jgi:hypothetical protein
MLVCQCLFVAFRSHFESDTMLLVISPASHGHLPIAKQDPEAMSLAAFPLASIVIPTGILPDADPVELTFGKLSSAHVSIWEGTLARALGFAMHKSTVKDRPHKFSL